MYSINKVIKGLKGRITAGKNTVLMTVVLSGFSMLSITGQTVATVQPLGEGITAKKFYSSAIGEDNSVWFLTESGIVCFDGSKWTLLNQNNKVAATGLKSLMFDLSSNGPELWVATSKGASVASLPFSATSTVSTYYPDNSKIVSENVLAIAAGKKDLRWFGTDKGISAIKNKKWLTNSYENNYPGIIFQDYTITSMSTSMDGDSLYVGTIGGGVFRVFRNEVDAVSGASEYAAWGPILMPSDTVYSVHIAADGVQWIGTKRGAARHTGYKTLEGWSVFTTVEGLADDLVQAINSDSKGNIYFGTSNGLSKFDGTKWTTYKTGNGLASNNILTIAVDKKDGIWIGTDNGVTSIKNGSFTIYR
jgi:ligand-binding sensor domain-containing protein